jgi:hypothetical protein
VAVTGAEELPYQDGTNHGHGIQDFLAIDPRLASDPDQARASPTLVEDELRETGRPGPRPRHVRDSGHRLEPHGDVFEHQGIGSIAD